MAPTMAYLSKPVRENPPEPNATTLRRPKGEQNRAGNIKDHDSRVVGVRRYFHHDLRPQAARYRPPPWLQFHFVSAESEPPP
ncbi:MAG: hypothetical protein ACI8RZ_004178 [Myxococcota bacterium]|jgi:hypothetical protein